MSDYTDITIILDRSGSMEEIHEETILGFNNFIGEQQKLDKKATLTLVQFDHEYERVYEARDLKKIGSLNYKSYQPRGTTALLDAIGRTIIDTDSRVSEFKPEKVVVVIITDGYENASTEYNRNLIFSMIAKHKKWDIIFLGANQDAIKEAGDLGIASDSSLTFQCDNDGISDALLAVSENISALRQKKHKIRFTDDQRNKQKR
ncbi:MAG: VWA domain-containing protein [Calditrichaeota bacterium]|nr:MAG: VWA domain-containing protein [Calditrichota bacterium]MBL1207135.1 VWA domain-containing protein [Calditrichota bacterium]NOG46965.1 VWA domain-containing protein [Calditrichota bacterium]